ncbi:MAG: protein kinase [Tannerella sp.]|jgi:serine/threonine protein kinase|nr:protein kinase [Tannerella sp.]
MKKVVQRCDFKTNDRIDNRYIVDTVLGEGSFGKVFKVRHLNGNVYALKLLKLWEIHPDIRDHLIDRFEMEYETGQIESPYLVQSAGYGYVSGNPYIVMEYCPNGDLIRYADGRMQVDFDIIGRQVLYGLRDLHKCGKVHRDLKPENVLFKEDGTAVLTDFGICGDRNKRMTERNLLGKPTQIFGTYGYMPPEQIKPKRGEATVLPTTDIFSFGVVMYQLITGYLPFGKLDSPNDLATYIRRGREGDWDRTVLNTSTRWKHFRNIIEGCLAPDFKTRIQTIDEVLKLFPGDRPKLQDPQSFQEEVVNGVLLRIMQGEEYGTVYKLNDMLKDGKRIVTIGRKFPDVFNSISILETNSFYISRRHCTLEWDATSRAWYIRDGQANRTVWGGWEKSGNGTYVNSIAVSTDGIVFRPGDIISMGDVKMRAEGY